MKKPRQDRTARSLKIGFVLDDGLDQPDGVQQYILTLGQWFGSKGHEVRYLVGESKRRDIDGLISLSRNINVVFNGNSLSIPLVSSSKRIKEVIEREKFDVIHVQVPYSPVMGAKVVKYSAGKSAIVGTFHVLPLSRLHAWGSRLLFMALRRNLKHIGKHFAVSEPAQKFAKEYYGIDSEVLGNPIRISRLYSSVKDRPKDFTIVFLGRLVPRKGCLLLLQAISKLDDNLKAQINVKIGGSGPQKAKLESYAEQNNLSGVVKFYGFVPENQKNEFLRTADLAVFPSYAGESFGIVLLEAMESFGPVVMAGNNPGYASVMSDDTANIFDPDDTAGLARRITGYFHNRQKLNQSLRRQRRIVKRFAVENIGTKLLDEYAKLLSVSRK